MAMNFVRRQLSTALFRRPSGPFSSSSVWWDWSHQQQQQQHQLQACRGIRVKVLNGNLERALNIMTRKMESSGMERLIKRQQRFHIKNSEKKILARKSLQQRIRAQDFARKIQSILIKKVRGR